MKNRASDETAQPASSRTLPQRKVVLIGMMGAGKSSIGRLLARRLGLAFTDTDDEIEAAAGCSVADFFKQYGEAAFRDGERRVMQRLLEGPDAVIATGGGTFLDRETRLLIKQYGVSVWLRADIDTLVERVGRRNSRPLLAGRDARAVLTRLAAERDPIYAEADISVDSGPRKRKDIVDSIVHELEHLPQFQA